MLNLAEATYFLHNASSRNALWYLMSVFVCLCVHVCVCVCVFVCSRSCVCVCMRIIILFHTASSWSFAHCTVNCPYVRCVLFQVLACALSLSLTHEHTHSLSLTHTHSLFHTGADTDSTQPSCDGAPDRRHGHDVFRGFMLLAYTQTCM